MWTKCGSLAAWEIEVGLPGASYRIGPQTARSCVGIRYASTALSSSGARARSLPAGMSRPARSSGSTTFRRMKGLFS